MNIAVILAGGCGRRMGGDIPKQFLAVAGVPVICRTVARFFAVAVLDRIIVAVPADYVQYTAQLLSDFVPGDPRVTVVSGGVDRNGSIVSVIRGCGLSADDVLVTHDAVRPFVTPAMISQSLLALCDGGCASAAIPSTDTVLRSSDGGSVDDVPPRGELYRVQTPQTFRAGDFTACLEHLGGEADALTDACGLFVRCGRPVRIFPGDAQNIKITTPFDLAVAECIAAEQEASAE